MCIRTDTRSAAILTAKEIHATALPSLCIAAAGDFLPVPISHAQSPVHSCLSSLILPCGLRPPGSVDSKGRWFAQAAKVLEVIDMQEIAMQEESCVQCSIEKSGGDLV